MTIDARRKLFDEIKSQKIPSYLVLVIATDRDVAYGDGTSPLLSASAGAQVRDGGPFDATRTARFLGTGVQVRLLHLQRPYSHGTMVNDLEVRQELLRFVSERRKAAGLSEEPRADDVGLMTLELTIKGGNPFNGTIEPVPCGWATAPSRPTSRSRTARSSPTASPQESPPGISTTPRLSGTPSLSSGDRFANRARRGPTSS